jgi:CRP-like cAMP-binding protein
LQHGLTQFALRAHQNSACLVILLSTTACKLKVMLKGDRFRTHAHACRDKICRANDTSDSLYFIMKGCTLFPSSPSFPNPPPSKPPSLLSPLTYSCTHHDHGRSCELHYANSTQRTIRIGQGGMFGEESLWVNARCTTVSSPISS